MENSMKTPQKTKNKVAISFSHTAPRNTLKECKSGYNKDTCTPMFIEARDKILHWLILKGVT
jgi:hypothetical protein